MENYKGKECIVYGYSAPININWTWSNNVISDCSFGDNTTMNVPWINNSSGFCLCKCLHISKDNKLYYGGKLVFDDYKPHKEEIQLFIGSFNLLIYCVAFYDFWVKSFEIKQIFNHPPTDQKFFIDSNGKFISLGNNISSSISVQEYETLTSPDNVLTRIVEIYPGHYINVGNVISSWGSSLTIGDVMLKIKHIESPRDDEYIDLYHRIIVHINMLNNSPSYHEYYQEIFKQRKSGYK